MIGLDEGQTEKDKVLKLFAYLLNQNIINSTQFAAGFSMILEMIEDLEIDIPGASEFLGVFMGHMMSVEQHALSISYLSRSLSHLIESGKGSEIAATTLSTVLKEKGEEFVVEKYKAAKIDFLNLMPEDLRESDSVESYLNEKGLGCLL